MAKLTLAVDDDVISRAKLYAKQHGTSVSKIVETYLSAVAGSVPPTRGATPVLRSVRGILTSGDTADFKKHLVTKYE